MLTEPLPEFIYPRQLAEQGRTLKGELDIRRMRRLYKQLTAQLGPVEVDLRLFREGARLCIAGHIGTVVERTCQRCLEPVRETLDMDVRLALVENEFEAGNLPDDYDPLPCGTETLSLFDVVEDELILALPIVAAHQRGECEMESAAETAERSGQERPNPFAVLSRLKRNE